jgi:cytochrome P450
MESILTYNHYYQYHQFTSAVVLTSLLLQVFWVSDGTHMNNDIFENPKVFDPSRFGNPAKPIPPYAYIPFGGGVHTCIGNEFARVETLTTIHNLVTMYKWTQVNPEEVITRQPMPHPSMGLPIKIKPRHLF